MFACDFDVTHAFSKRTAAEQIWGLATPDAGDACQACLLEVCETSAEKCADDRSCSTMGQCLSKCESPTCARSCGPLEEAALEPIACWRETCFDACWVGRGWVSKAEQLFRSDDLACAECIEKSCDEEVDACFSDDDCRERTSCVAECDDPICAEACVRSLTSTVPRECRLIECPERCKAGRRWECLGEYSYSRSELKNARIELTFTDMLTFAVVPGLTVDVCPQADQHCKLPVTRGTTDEHGFVALDLSMPVFDGYLYVHGADIIPTLFYAHSALGGDRKDTLRVISQAVWDANQDLLGIARMEDRGAILAEVRDCFHELAPAVAVSVTGTDQATATGYTMGTAVVLDLKESNQSGLAFILNIKPGLRTLTGRYTPTGERVVDRDVWVRPGALTLAATHPTPAR